MAGKPGSDSRLAEWRRLFIAKTGHPDLAAAEERTSSAGLRRGHLASGSRNGRHRGLLQPAALQLRYRREKKSRIRMVQSCIDSGCRHRFQYSASIKHDHVVADRAHGFDVVADKHVRETELLPQFHDEIEDRGRDDRI